MPLQETIPGTKDLGYRLADGETAFVEQLKETGGFSLEVAEKVFALYQKNKLIKREFSTGHWAVKHGAYWEADVLARAAEMVA